MSYRATGLYQVRCPDQAEETVRAELALHPDLSAAEVRSTEGWLELAAHISCTDPVTASGAARNAFNVAVAQLVGPCRGLILVTPT